MKVFDIALKDLLRAFRSAFLLVMMFVAPLLITGLIYLAFSGNVGGGGLSISPVKVVIVNRDSPDQHAGFSAGATLVGYLTSKDLSRLLEATVVPDEASARQAVDNKEAAAAVIIPPNLTSALMDPKVSANVEVYHDPALSIGPGIVKTLVNDFTDGLAGAKIAVVVAASQMSAQGLTLSEQSAQALTQRYVQWVQSGGSSSAGSSLVVVRAPSSDAPPPQQQTNFIAGTMAGMLIFFVFFTGAAMAETIVREDEEGTLPRLVTTPTTASTILGGKFSGSMVTVVVQTTVLMAASVLLFSVYWGQPLPLLMVIVGLVIAACGFGVLFMSLVKNTRQAGPMLGGILAIIGMLGGLFFPIPTDNQVLHTLSLLLPPAWALDGLKLAQAGAGAAEVLVPTIVLLTMGALCFAVGTVMFRRRFV